MDKVNDRRIVHLLAQGEPSERTREFLQAFESPVPEVLLIEGTRLVHGRIGEGVPLDPNGLVVPVLLDADRMDIRTIFDLAPIAAAIEKYALFSWWRRRDVPNGAYWIHGLTRVAERLGPDIELSPLYSSEHRCAFGSATCPGLPALLSRYLAAYATDRGQAS